MKVQVGVWVTRNMKILDGDVEGRAAASLVSAKWVVSARKTWAWWRSGRPWGKPDWPHRCFHNLCTQAYMRGLLQKLPRGPVGSVAVSLAPMPHLSLHPGVTPQGVPICGTDGFQLCSCNPGSASREAGLGLLLPAGEAWWVLEASGHV